MNSAVPIALMSTPGSSFDEPFGMLGACHERVLRMLGLLRRLRAHVAAMGVDQQARQAARDVMRYFDVAAPLHHQDEEQHVFPLLLAQGAFVDEVHRLQRDHDEMRNLWPRVREVLADVSEGTRTGFAPEDEALLQHYCSLYDWHVAAENELVYPAARARMDAGALHAMGEDMARRRGIR